MAVIFSICGKWYVSQDNKDATCPKCGHSAHGPHCTSLDYETCVKEPWPCGCEHDCRKNKHVRTFKQVTKRMTK